MPYRPRFDEGWIRTSSRIGRWSDAVVSAKTREALSPLGDAVVGEALPATPIVEPTKLYHLRPGHWEYRILAGANRGQVQKVQLEHAAPDDRGATWQLVTDTGDLQQFKVTHQHEVVKLAQEDADSDRLVVYRPGLVVDPGLQVGQSKTVNAKISSTPRYMCTGDELTVEAC